MATLSSSGTTEDTPMCQDLMEDQFPLRDKPADTQEPTGEIITIVYGPHLERFDISKERIASKSKVFAKRLRLLPEFNGFALKDLGIDGMTINAFAVIRDWLITGLVTPIGNFIIDENGALVGYEKRHEFRKAMSAMIAVYCAADKLEMPELMDLSMELIAEGYLSNDAWPSGHEISNVYKGTPLYKGEVKERSSCKLRKYMARAFHYMLVVSDYHTWDEQECSVMEADMLYILKKKLPELDRDVFYLLNGMMPNNGSRSLADPRKGLICKYHLHDSDEECWAVGKTFQDITPDAWEGQQAGIKVSETKADFDPTWLDDSDETNDDSEEFSDTESSNESFDWFRSE